MHYVLIKVFVVADSSDDQLQKTAEVIMNMPVHGSSIRQWAVAAWPDIRTSMTETVMNSYTNWRRLLSAWSTVSLSAMMLSNHQMNMNPNAS